MCLAVMYNFAFALFLLLGKSLLKLFVGTLRDLEVEQLVDNGRGFLADTILFLVFYAPTIDNKEVDTVYLIQYICCVIFMKVFHLTTQIRVSHMFEVGVPRLIVNAKLVTLMVLLLSIDILALRYFYTVASRSSTFFTWILFEALTMSTIVLVSIWKYSVHMVDLRLDNGWPAKSVCLFYIDLVHDVVSMTLFLVFMLTFFEQNTNRMPNYIMADVIQVARKLASRLRSFRRYRRISTNMEARFADATDEEIEQNENCVICRDSLFEGSKAKKLACGHIFHIDCLRSWLVMQQVCPTCRAEIPADGPCLHGQPPPAVPPAGEQQVPAPAAAETVPAAAAPAGSAAPTGPASTPTVAAAASSAPAPSGTANVAAAVAALVAAPASIPKQATFCPAASASGAGTAEASAPAASASASAAPIPRLFELGDTSALGSALGTLPPVHDILESLRRAEETSKFLRQQSEFWMQQVQMIQKSHTPQTQAQAPPDASSFLAAQYSSLLGMGASSISAAASVSPTPASPAPISPATVQEATAQEAPTYSAPATVPASTMESSPGAAGASSPTAVPSIERSMSEMSTGSVQDQMAELRRAQKEAWERKRTLSKELESPISPSQTDGAEDGE
jgi:E3 ubiquitin-protein ligase synoviolin